MEVFFFRKCLKEFVEEFLNESWEEFITDYILLFFRDGDRLTIELGRVLRKGEYKINLYYFNVNDVVDDLDKLPFLCNWIVRNGQQVGQVKKDVLAHLATSDSKYNNLKYECCRLRRKCWKSISKVYLDEYQIGEDVTLNNNSDVS